jgi:hypothetical protein
MRQGNGNFGRTAAVYVSLENSRLTALAQRQRGEPIRARENFYAREKFTRRCAMLLPYDNRRAGTRDARSEMRRSFSPAAEDLSLASKRQSAAVRAALLLKYATLLYLSFQNTPQEWALSPFVLS